MAIVDLHRGDFRIIKPVAQQLYLHWEGIKDSNYYATLTGICAEYAVIAYLNDYCGASPKIPFRTEYINGGDGGFDFAAPDDLTWDVKCAGRDEDFDPYKVLKTKSNVICFVRRLSSRTYLILGFAPRSRLNKEDLNLDRLIPIEMLPKIFPTRFLNQDSSPLFSRKYRTDLTRAGGLVSNLILDVQTRLRINSEG